jgi:hypothetical protein
MAFLEGGGGAFDQCLGVGQLPGEGVLVGLVGDEDRAGQAGVALVAGLQGRQQAPAVGKEPVGAVEQVQAVVVFAGEAHPGAVGLELDGGQERLLGVLLAFGDVVHGHGRGGVSGIALQDVDRQPEFGKTGQLGVPESVGMAEPDRSALAVGDLQQVAELAQHPVVGAGGIRSVAAAVPGASEEQELRVGVGEVCTDPCLLFLDHRDDVLVDQDAVRCDVDLALGVGEPGDLFTVGVGGGAGDRGQAVEVAGADFAGATAGEDLQQDHAHRLGVVEPAGEHPGLRRGWG